MTEDFIRIDGARQNNLKNLKLDIPLERFVCITGPSGSGKSSLAFDTLYAEGHRRYVESLSTYARQFFERVPKPDVDSIENICPSIAIEQRNPVKNSRSTLGTSTEIYDYLRLLFDKLGKAYCPNGHGVVESDSPHSAAEEVLASLGKTEDRAYLGFVLPEATEAGHLVERGFLRRLKNSKSREVVDLEDERSKKLKKGSFIIVDRLVVTASDRERLVESLETAFQQGEGQAFLYLLSSEKFWKFSAKHSCSRCGAEVPDLSPLLFSFNSPIGACDHCKGFGNVLEYDPELIIPNKKLSIDRGAVEPLTKKIMTKGRRLLKDFCKKNDIPTDLPYQDLPAKQRKDLWGGSGKFPGIYGAFKKMEQKKYKLHVRVFLRRYQSSFECEVCHGARLKPESLLIRFHKKNIYELCQMSLGELEKWFKKIRLGETEKEIADEVLKQIQGRLHFLNRMGLEYLNLGRLTKTLSGGEAQRINLANQLGAELSGTLYVLDEPSIGLHASDRDRLLDSLDELVERGNSVIVVEHDMDTISRAEQVIEMGPCSGRKGGEVVFQGGIKAFRRSKSETAQYLTGKKRIEPPKNRRGKAERWISIQGASENNLQSVNLNIPLNRLVGISGVSGSGKSSLIHQTLYNALARLFEKSTNRIGRFEKIFGVEQIKGAKLLDQSPVGKSSRSIPLSVVGGYDEVRKLFAETRDARLKNLQASHFSFNVGGGRCETCMGEGMVKTEMYFLDDLYLVCEDCNGKRFKKDILEVRYRGKSIDDVLHMTFSEARYFFASSKSLIQKFQLIEKVGLGYLQLGQASHSLSGGESQRLKIATEIANVRRKGVLYILDEPSTGLHLTEVGLLIGLMGDLVESGNTVVVIEHHLDILKCVDWLVDLGPGPGVNGGKIVAEGPPEEHIKLSSLTGAALKKVMKGDYISE